MSGNLNRTGDAVVLEQLFGVARRRWKVVVLATLIGLALGWLYALAQTPIYSSAATVMVRSGPAADPIRQGVETTTPEEEGQFLSQLELAKSSSVAIVVADRLDLVNDADFARSAPSGLTRLMGRISARLGMETGPSDAAARQLKADDVVSILQANVGVSRVGRTYVAAVSYRHPDPAVARKVAQSFAEAFRQRIAQDNDLANSRIRASLQAEIDRVPEAEKPALRAKLQDLMISRALPGMDVIVMSDAKLPPAPIAPRVPFLMAVGAILGAVVGCAIAGFRELTDHGVRDGDATARALGIRFLGYLPRGGGKLLGSMTMGKGAALPEAARRAVTEPYSVFGETIRSLAVAVGGRRQDGQGTVTGITSVLPGDSTTIVAANLASHLANQGRSVLLIDADARDPRLSAWLAADAEMGLVDSLLQNKSTDETLLYDSRSNLSLLPMVLKDRTVEPSSLFSGERANAFVAELRGQYQHIIIDFAALSSAADARAAAAIVDGFILTAQWGRATPQLLADLLEAEPEVRAKLIGLVLTRTDLKKLPLYAEAGSRAAFQRQISKG